MLVGLILRLADSAPNTAGKAAARVYERIAACPDPVSRLALLEVLRASAVKHDKAAAAVLACCSAELRQRETRADSAAAAPGDARPLSGHPRIEADVCLQMLRLPALRSQAMQAITRAVAHGVMSKEEVPFSPQLLILQAISHM
jgi:hypothetical protein